MTCFIILLVFFSWNLFFISCINILIRTCGETSTLEKIINRMLYIYFLFIFFYSILLLRRNDWFFFFVCFSFHLIIKENTWSDTYGKWTTIKLTAIASKIFFSLHFIVWSSYTIQKIKTFHLKDLSTAKTKKEKNDS